MKKKTPRSVTVMFDPAFFIFAIFYGTFSGMNYFTCQNKMLHIANEIVSKSKILLKHEVNNTGRKN